MEKREQLIKKIDEFEKEFMSVIDDMAHLPYISKKFFSARFCRLRKNLDARHNFEHELDLLLDSLLYLVWFVDNDSEEYFLREQLSDIAFTYSGILIRERSLL